MCQCLRVHIWACLCVLVHLQSLLWLPKSLCLDRDIKGSAVSLETHAIFQRANRTVKLWRNTAEIVEECFSLISYVWCLKHKNNLSLQLWACKLQPVIMTWKTFSSSTFAQNYSLLNVYRARFEFIALAVRP